MGGNLPHIPLEVFISWPTPDYVDPVRRTWMPLYVGILQAVTTLLVCIRLWLRIRNKAGPFGMDDAFLIPAYLGATMMTTIIILDCVQYDSDRHLWDVPPTKYEGLALMAWLSEVAFLTSTCATKVSVLLFYRRLVRGSYNRMWRWLTLGAIYFTVLYGVGLIFALIFNCRPTNAYWKSLSITYTGDYTCTDTRWLNGVSGILSVLSDFYAVLLPMGILHKFDIDRRKKIALYTVFSFGLLVVAAGSVRTYYLHQLGYNYDITWTGFNVFIWSALEVHGAIICASVPVLRVLFRQYLRGPLSRARNTGTGRSHQEASIHAEPRSIPTPDIAKQKQEYHSASKYNVTASLGSISEYEVDAPSALPNVAKAPILRTPDEYEAYALHSIDRYRSNPRRHGYMRSDSFGERDLSPSECTGGTKTPISWLDMENRY